MTDSPVVQKPLHEYPTMEEARQAATDMAVAEMSYPLPGNFYQQGGRRFVSLALPLDKLFEMAIQPERLKKGQAQPDPEESRNRPLNKEHVRNISTYLLKNEAYLIPPIIVNSNDTLDIFMVTSTLASRPCIVVVPKKDALYVADGQHRVEALREASKEKPELLRDGVGVTLIEEMDIQRIHQDFYDAAQTKKLEPALLVQYDGRSRGNALARTICTTVPLFKERTERISNNIGKNSLKLYSANHVKLACFHLILGDVKGKAPKILERINQKIGESFDAWVSRIQAFFAFMIEENPQWRAIIEKPLSSGQITDPVPEYRAKYLHCGSAGLSVMCAVGHKILSFQETVLEDFTPEQQTLLHQLATFDWSKTNPLWYGGIVSTSGSITPHRGNFALAVAKVKQALGLELTASEDKALEKSVEVVGVGAEGEEA